MKRLLATTAVALALTTGSYAANMNTFTSDQFERGSDFYASNFIGMRIYATETDVGDNYEYTDGAEKEWDDIGEVDDIIVSKDGSIKAVILGVGGFLGLGEKDVSVSMDDIRVVREKGDVNDYFLVVKANKDTLMNAESYERDERDMKRETAMGRPATGDDQNNAAMEEKMAEEQAAERSAAVERPEREMLRTPTMTPEGYRDADTQSITEERLEGARLYDASNEDIGEVHDVVMANGKVETVILDIGGFLGLGEHRIGVSMDEIKVVRTEDDSDWRVYIDASKEELEKQPEYKQQS